jgi:hypothetical protein
LVDVEVLPVFGGTGPPDKLTDVADVLLVIPDDAAVLVLPGVDALICVGLVKVNGSKLVAPAATHPTSVTVGPERELDPYGDGCGVADCTAVGVVDVAVGAAKPAAAGSSAVHKNA